MAKKKTVFHDPRFTKVFGNNSIGQSMRTTSSEDLHT